MQVYVFENITDNHSEFAHAKLKHILKEDYNYDLTELSYTKYKKPYIKNLNIQFNISHCKNCAVIVIDNQEIGVDVETYDRYDKKLLNKLFNNDEILQITTSSTPNKEFTKLWCMKESLLKCIGTGLKLNVTNVLDIQDQYTFEIMEKEHYLISICKRK